MNNIAFNYDEYLGPYLFEPYALDLVERLQLNDTERILEVACGTGRLTKHLVKILNANCQLVATDINEEMLAIAKQKITDKRLAYQTADAHTLNFPSNTFNLVICQFGLMFFQDKQKALQEIIRVLKPGGRFLFNIWGKADDNPMSALMQQIVSEIFKEKSPDFNNRGPYSTDINVIAELLEVVGFTNVTTEVVKKEAPYYSIDDFLKGFLYGSPLATFLGKQEIELQNQLQQQYKEEVEKYYNGKLKVTMLAYVISAMKG